VEDVEQISLIVSSHSRILRKQTTLQIFGRYLLDVRGNLVC
jgi:hypothetical protein